MEGGVAEDIPSRNAYSAASSSIHCTVSRGRVRAQGKAVPALEVRLIARDVSLGPQAIEGRNGRQVRQLGRRRKGLEERGESRTIFRQHRNARRMRTRVDRRR